MEGGGAGGGGGEFCGHGWGLGGEGRGVTSYVYYFGIPGMIQPHDDHATDHRPVRTKKRNTREYTSRLLHPALAG